MLPDLLHRREEREQRKVWGDGGYHSNDPYETNFIDHGQRNIFRQTRQIRADISLVKATQIDSRYSLKHKLDVFNLTNTASFDIPIDDVSQNINFNGFPWNEAPSPLPATLPPCKRWLHRISLCLSDTGRSGHNE